MGIFENFGSKLGIPTAQEQRDQKRAEFYFDHADKDIYKISIAKDNLGEALSAVVYDLRRRPMSNAAQADVMDGVAALVDSGDIRPGKELLVAFNEDVAYVDCI